MTNWTPTCSIVGPHTEVHGQVYSCPNQHRSRPTKTVHQKRTEDPKWKELFKKVKARREYCEHLARNPVTLFGYRFGDI